MKTINIEVVGSGCKKCKTLFELTKEVAQELHIYDTVLYITDVNKIVSMGLMSSPVLILNSKPILVGMVPGKERLKEVISNNLK